MQYRWVAGGNRTFLEVASMVVIWWRVAFLWHFWAVLNIHNNLLMECCKYIKLKDSGLHLQTCDILNVIQIH